MATTGHFSFNDFYLKHYRRTFLFAKSYVHDAWEAEDIASEALISLWEITKKHEIDHPLAFLLSIVKNRAIDYLRHEMIRQEALEALTEIGMRELNTRLSTLEACDPEKIYSKEVMDIVETTLRTLPVKTREIFRMSRYRNMPKNVIAAKLNMSPKSIEYHITKALAALRVSLKDYLPLFYFMFFYQ
ncbi:MAG: RNA polymerase sigma-70 factor [Tannerella sp.]|jgi:RNA polymerase sigma-70 factor (ECF subfamily)|nr:RNA polymerase sigma-70 factor [Tannerella sp.]